MSPEETLEIKIQDRTVEAKEAILVPANAQEYPDTLVCMIAGSPANAKHAYHTLSQIALYDFEDKVLAVQPVPKDGVIAVIGASETQNLSEGLIIYRDIESSIFAWAHNHLDTYPLIKFAHRQCTRWVRLDI